MPSDASLPRRCPRFAASSLRSVLPDWIRLLNPLQACAQEDRQVLRRQPGRDRCPKGLHAGLRHGRGHRALVFQGKDHRHGVLPGRRQSGEAEAATSPGPDSSVSGSELRGTRASRRPARIVSCCRDSCHILCEAVEQLVAIVRTKRTDEKCSQKPVPRLIQPWLDLTQ